MALRNRVSRLRVFRAEPLRARLSAPTLSALRPPDYTGCMNLAEEKLEGLRATLRRDGRFDAAYLLGSAHEGTFRPDSDVDIAVLPAPGSLRGHRAGTLRSTP